ncbi:MAG: helix-turn-helix transcriptional regulator [Candidatus Margulisbacteria bacterium]|nr:helix-turn-helix transcriptional regulator [Candidatus Margulisiibacteriota bacterium]
MPVNVKNVREIGMTFKKRRKEFGFTQKETAWMCNVGTRFLSDLENGKATLEIDKVFNVCQQLGLNVNIQ